MFPSFLIERIKEFELKSKKNPRYIPQLTFSTNTFIVSRFPQFKQFFWDLNMNYPPIHSPLRLDKGIILTNNLEMLSDLIFYPYRMEENSEFIKIILKEGRINVSHLSEPLAIGPLNTKRNSYSYKMNLKKLYKDWEQKVIKDNKFWQYLFIISINDLLKRHMDDIPSNNLSNLLELFYNLLTKVDRGVYDKDLHKKLGSLAKRKSSVGIKAKLLSGLKSIDETPLIVLCYTELLKELILED